MSNSEPKTLAGLRVPAQNLTNVFKYRENRANILVIDPMDLHKQVISAPLLLSSTRNECFEVAHEHELEVVV